MHLNILFGENVCCFFVKFEVLLNKNRSNQITYFACGLLLAILASLYIAHRAKRKKICLKACDRLEDLT